MERIHVRVLACHSLLERQNISVLLGYIHLKKGGVKKNMKNKNEKDTPRYRPRPHRDDQLEFNLNINDDRKYKLEFEIIELKEEERPQRTVKIARKNLKKMILNRINGKIGEC